MSEKDEINFLGRMMAKDPKYRKQPSKNREKQMVCPFCGCDTFNRNGHELVKMIDTGDGVRDELAGGMSDSFGYTCAKCEKDVTEEELKTK